MKHIEKIEKEFDLEYIKGNLKIEREGDGVPFKEIKSFLRHSHTSFIQNLIQRVEGEKAIKSYPTANNGYNTELTDEEKAVNSALDTIIKMLKEEIC